MSIDFDTPGTGDEQPDWMEEPIEGGEPDGGDGNRLFAIIAIGLAGLIVLGLFAVGGLLLIRRARTAQQISQITPTVFIETPIAVVPTATFTPTPLPPTPTDTPTIAPTNTRVVQETLTPSSGEGQGTVPGGEATPIPTRTPIPVATPVSGGEVPNTGFGGFEAGMIALGLIAILFVSRRLRRAS
jgi:hypothetical protein